jgi:hypothetical protein
MSPFVLLRAATSHKGRDEAATFLGWAEMITVFG